MLNCTIFNLSVACHAEPLPSCTCLLLLVLYLTLIESCCNILQQTLITIAKLSCFTCTSIKAKIDFFTRTSLLKRECFHVRVPMFITVCLCSLQLRNTVVSDTGECVLFLSHITHCLSYGPGMDHAYTNDTARGPK